MIRDQFKITGMVRELRSTYNKSDISPFINNGEHEIILECNKLDSPMVLRLGRGEYVNRDLVGSEVNILITFKKRSKYFDHI